MGDYCRCRRKKSGRYLLECGRWASSSTWTHTLVSSLAWSLWTALPHLVAQTAVSQRRPPERQKKKKRKRKKKFEEPASSWFLVLTLSLQHLQGGLCSGPGISLGFGQRLALLLHPLLALLLFLLLLLPALQLQALLKGEKVSAEASG